MDLTPKIIEILAKQLNVSPDKITLSSELTEDLGMDSLDSIEIVMALEEEFGIEIPDEDTERLKKVNDIVTYLQKRLSKT